jgi:hypothetical protein
LRAYRSNGAPSQCPAMRIVAAGRIHGCVSEMPMAITLSGINGL